MNRSIFTRISVALAIVFLTIFVMTTWWQYLFKETLEDYYIELESARLETGILRALGNDPEKLKLLITEGLIEKKPTCTLKPCVFTGGKNGFYYQITAGYLAQMENKRDRKINMFYWETSFLMFFLLIGIAYLAWVLYREKMAQNEKRDFLAMTTHELKHPISVVSLILESLKKGTIPEKRKIEFYDKGMDELRDLKKSLENILKVQEFEFRTDVKTQPYKLNSHVQGLIEKWQLETLNKEGRIRFKPCKGDLMISVHPRLVDMIMNNLIENALLYSEKEVVIECGRDHRGKYIEVSDSGLGFNDEEKKNFKKMFYRSSRHEIQNKRGTGLGHFIITKISHASGIMIFLDSPGENMGSKFKVYVK